MKSKKHHFKKTSIHYLSFLAFALFITKSSLAADPNIFQINGDIGQYLSFNLVDGTDDTCRQGAPDYPKVTGLPAGMFISSNCIIFGTPENVGTSRLEFPVVGGVWLADLVITGNSTNPDPTPNPDPDPTPEPDPNPTNITPPTPEEIAAARFLSQSTFGPTIDEIKQLAVSNDYEGWINQQLEKPISVNQLDALKNLHTHWCYGNEVLGTELSAVWWNTVLNGDDQLRQRVAFALSEILVISKVGALDKRARGLADYYDVLIENAFGNYRDLLREVTLHPTMGIYLSMLRNEKANLEENIRPDENYARELLQLFSVGVNQLNLDGSIIKQTNGSPKPTYNQAIIEDFAKVFTGWNIDGINTWSTHFSQGDFTVPMTFWDDYHDSENEKHLLNNTVLPAGQLADQDLDDALDNVFKHPNVGPFIGKQLIQRLVTSNPSSAYIQRVAKVFNGNGGANERGDLKAVVKAILLDQEARAMHSASDNFGKLREPLLRLSHLRRAFGVIPVTHNQNCGRGDFQLYTIAALQNVSLKQHQAFGQDILHSPSVFNFFLPSYSPPGIVTNANLVAPEFQINTENTMVALTNAIGDEIQASGTSRGTTKIILDTETALAIEPNALLNHLNLLLLSGNMSPGLQGLLLELLENDVYPDSETGRANKTKDAIMLIVNSPDYLIQK
ncbi:MAG: DUF1800 family protein [Methylococcales bacterium]